MQKGRIWARPEGGFRLTRRFYLDERKGLKSAEETGLGYWGVGGRAGAAIWLKESLLLAAGLRNEDIIMMIANLKSHFLTDFFYVHRCPTFDYV